MAKQTPQYIKNLVYRMNKKVYEVQLLNEQLEQWLEKNGVADDGFDFNFDYRESTAYEIATPESYFEKIDKALKGGD